MSLHECKHLIILAAKLAQRALAHRGLSSSAEVADTAYCFGSPRLRSLAALLE